MLTNTKNKIQNEVNIKDWNLITLALFICGLISIFYVKGLSSVSKDAPPGWAMIEEDKLLSLINEPTYKMQLAYEHFLKKEDEKAGEDLQKVSTYLNLSASNASIGVKKLLLQSASEIDRLANEIFKGTITSDEDLKTVFSRAEEALANYHYDKARSGMGNKQHRTLGHYLSSAIKNIESSAKWTGRKIEEGTSIMIDDFGKRLNWIEEELKKFKRSSKKIPPLINNSSKP